MPRPRTGRSNSRSQRGLGPEAERRVRRHYRLRGYRILAANARVGGYELDIVVRRGRTVTVCEVKARRTDAFGPAAAAVGAAKQQRLRRLAAAWLATSRGRWREVRFDVVAITGDHLEVVERAF